MKRVILLILVMGLLLGGCKTTSADPSKLQVVTSFYVIYDFAKKIGAEHVQVTNLVSGAQEPHDYELTSGDMILLQKKSVLLVNGLGLEPWLDKLKETVNNPDLTIVTLSKNIDILNTESQADPHIWLDIERAKIMLKNIAEAFSAADPINASDYQANYTKYVVLFDALNENFKYELKSVSKNVFVTTHAAFAYLADAYGLNQIYTSGVLSYDEPSSEAMTKIIELVKTNKVTTIFYEQAGDSKIAEVIANATGAKIAILNPLEGLSQKQIDQGEDYLSVMKNNLSLLSEALK